MHKKCLAWLHRGAGFIHCPLFVSPAPCSPNPAGLAVQGAGAGCRAQAELPQSWGEELSWGFAAAPNHPPVSGLQLE